MLDYVMQQRREAAERLRQLEREAMRLQGAIVALDDVIEHERKQQTGGGAPTPAPATAALAPDMAKPAAHTPVRALRVGHAPIQADEELRE